MGELVWQFGIFTLDNARNNYTALEHIASKYWYAALDTYILNLVVRVFPYGKKSETSHGQGELEAWRKKASSLGKLRGLTQKLDKYYPMNILSSNAP